MVKSTVLVVDDDEDNALALESALESIGFAVRVARSCAEARRALAGAPVDALVTDFSLGDGDGLELLLSLGATRPRVAVVVSGHGGAAAEARTLAAGFDGHLVKPIDLAQLERMLRNALAEEKPPERLAPL